MLADQIATLAVLANDSDPDGDALEIVAVTQGGKGTVSIAGDELVYAPVQGAKNRDSFRYTIEDSSGDSDEATVTIQFGKMSRIKSVSRLPAGGGIGLEFNGPIQSLFRVQGSRDGWLWNPLGEGVSDADGNGVFMDADISANHHRFYRIEWP